MDLWGISSGEIKMNKGVMSKEGIAIGKIILCMTSLILGILYDGPLLFNILFGILVLFLLVENWDTWELKEDKIRIRRRIK